MSDTDTSKVHDAAGYRAVLHQIRTDVAADAKAFDGAPFTGATVAEMFGNHGAAIAWLAKAVESLLPAEEPAEPDPVPFVDFLPEDLAPIVASNQDDVTARAQAAATDVKPAISDERVQEILDGLNGFVDHEYEGYTEIVNGRAVWGREIVGSDWNLDRAVEWALGLPECSTAVGPNGDDADVELVDGTVLIWSADRRWEIALPEVAA